MNGAAAVLPSTTRTPSARIETTIGTKYHFLLCLINITSSLKKLGFFLNSSGDFIPTSLYLSRSDIGGVFKTAGNNCLRALLPLQPSTRASVLDVGAAKGPF